MDRVLEIRIQGMHCEGCVATVTAALARLEGVHVRQVSPGKAVVAFDPARMKQSEVLDAIRRAGPYSIVSFSRVADVQPSASSPNH